MKKMKLYPSSKDAIDVYQPIDIDERYRYVITKASALWETRCKAYLNAHGDQGTCVLGAGIEIYYLAPRCRRPGKKMIISASRICAAQGASVWESSVKEVLEYLRKRGIECQYNSGNMD